jgi:hypothetical protein
LKGGKKLTEFAMMGIGFRRMKQTKTGKVNGNDAGFVGVFGRGKFAGFGKK